MDRLLIDIGGTKMSAGVLLEGRAVGHFRQAATPAQEGPERITDVALELVADLLPDAASLHVAMTGLVRDGTVTALNPKTLPGWDAYPLRGALERRTNREVVVVNDAHAATWGEYRVGAGCGHDVFAFVTVSTGIGGGLVVDGRPALGSTGLAGHLGFTLPRPGTLTILEALASGTAIATRAGPSLPVHGTARDAFAAAKAGKGWARALVRSVAEELATAIANLKVVVDPEVVAIGGGVGLADGFLGSVAHELERLPALYRVPVVAARLGSRAGLIGVGLWPTG